MGKLFSKCLDGKNRARSYSYQRMGDVFPFPCHENIIDSSEHNDEKFHFIKNERKIDGIINHLDELPITSENDISLLEKTLSELRALKHLLAPSTQNTLDRFLMVSEGTPEEKRSDEYDDTNFDKEENLHGRNSTRAQSLGIRELSKQTILLSEIQKATFLHSKLLEKYRLSQPYIVTKVYFKTNQDPLRDIWNEVKQFETPKGVSTMNPEWNHMIECQLEENLKAPMYSIGISLFYISARDNTIFQVGEEQTFSFEVLSNQKVQVKQIDFKDPVLKGVLAKLKVRFQLLHNAEEVREKNTRDIKTRIERLIKIRERHANLFPDKLDFASYSNSGRNGLSHGGSLGSTSSLHDNGDSSFYVT